MTKLFLYITLLVTLCECNSQPHYNKINTDKQKIKDTSLVASQEVLEESLHSKMPLDSLGELFSQIDFRLKAVGRDLETFEDGIIPWISLDNPDKDLKKLIKPDIIVLPFSKATIVIDYPLKNPLLFKIETSKKGFSRKELIVLISKKYHEIYDIEEQTSSVKTTPVAKRVTLMNRNETDGTYGIWGHDLSDLDLDSIDVYKNANGIIYLSLNIES